MVIWATEVAWACKTYEKLKDECKPLPEKKVLSSFLMCEPENDDDKLVEEISPQEQRNYIFNLKDAIRGKVIENYLLRFFDTVKKQNILNWFTLSFCIRL